MPKIKDEDHEELPPINMYPRQIGDTAASSSVNRVRSSFIGMGFAPPLIDKAIEKCGGDDELILETLLKYSPIENNKPESQDLLGGLPNDELLNKSHSESSDSLDRLFEEKEGSSNQENCAENNSLKLEDNVSRRVNAGQKASLLTMNFSVDEVDFAIDKLGEDATISELVDFIFAAQIAGKDRDCANHLNAGRNEDRHVNKTVKLLEMGFPEQEISSAIEKYGSKASVAELADSIVSGQTSSTSVDKQSSASSSLNWSDPAKRPRPVGLVMVQGSNCYSFHNMTVKDSPEATSRFRNVGLAEKYYGKRPKEEYIDMPASLKRTRDVGDGKSSSFNRTLLESRQSICMTTSSQMPVSQKKYHEVRLQDAAQLIKSYSCTSLDIMVARPPYFFYGNVMAIPRNAWVKISQFLYTIEPEFVNTNIYSALSRKEGYVHNLPTTNRFHVMPKSPMTIQEAVPCSRKWWPLWDARKHLSFVNAETRGISEQCDKLERMLIDFKGLISVDQQRDFLYQCQRFNLVWASHSKLKPVEPEHVERILGYPVEHTLAPGLSLTERLHLLKHCFQTDALGYHLSVLKPMFPGGVTVLSVYSGIGGAEVAIHRLGIRLKCVVSVDPNETKRRILKRWWSISGQSGELMQIDNIQSLKCNKIETLMQKFGGFDLIICQNPCTDTGEDAVNLNFSGLEFTRFCEFVRILQRVRSMSK